MLTAFAGRKRPNVPKRDMSFLENYVSSDIYGILLRVEIFSFALKTLSFASQRSIDGAPSAALKISSTRVDTHPINCKRIISQIPGLSGNNNILIISGTVQQPPVC